jgi:hypothetical protein
MVMNNLFFLGMLGDPPMVVFEPLNVILTPAGIDPHVEEFSVGVSLLDICNTSTLLLIASLSCNF